MTYEYLEAIDQSKAMFSAFQLGAIFLDKYFYNSPLDPWYWRVDLQRLNMESPRDCVLGQLFGSFAEATARLELGLEQSLRYGFATYRSDYKNLTMIAKQIIEDKRSMKPYVEKQDTSIPVVRKESVYI